MLGAPHFGHSFLWVISLTGKDFRPSPWNKNQVPEFASYLHDLSDLVLQLGNLIHLFLATETVGFLSSMNSEESTVIGFRFFRDPISINKFCHPPCRNHHGRPCMAPLFFICQGDTFRHFDAGDPVLPLTSLMDNPNWLTNLICKSPFLWLYAEYHGQSLVVQDFMSFFLLVMTMLSIHSKKQT